MSAATAHKPALASVIGTTPPAPSPVDVLELRAWARAVLWAEGEISDIPAAVDPLQHFALASLLVDEIGQDRVQRIIADAFAPYREAEL